MNWQEKLNKFLETWEYADDTIGILVCGSFITGSPSSHSDLDVHIILKENVKFRERGNKIIDGLLIEYFANPPGQIRKYFKKDYEDIRPLSQVQFITGLIYKDTDNTIQNLKKEALEWMEKKYVDIDTSINPQQKYSLWDMMDDIEDAYENNRLDFDFIYYSNLDKLLTIYMRYIKYPYKSKTILGNINSEICRNKYLQNELPDKEINELIQKSILKSERKIKLESYKKLTNKILNLMGGFEIDGFKFKSQID